MKKIWSVIKPYFRWGIVGGTLFFLAKTLKDHWQEVAGIQINRAGWFSLLSAFAITLLAHICSAWVWFSLVKAFNQPVETTWGIQVYLKTNVAKYLPGNVWHFYGRIAALTRAGGSLVAASFSVLLEPLLIAAAALAIGLSSWGLSWQAINSHAWVWALQVLILVGLLIGLHPQVLNRALQMFSRFQGKVEVASYPRVCSYPWVALIGALSFLLLRGGGFCLTLLAFMPISPQQLPQLLSAFSFAWLLGLVIPGAPGGIGVFEATALGLLEGEFPPGLLLSALALFRLVSFLAELSGAGLAIVSQRLCQ